MNEAIELHDSELLAILAVRDDVVLICDCFIHVSNGVPGVDDGELHSQVLAFSFPDGQMTGEESLVGGILDGTLESGVPSRRFPNMFPLSSVVQGPVSLWLVFGESGSELMITGRSLNISQVGARRHCGNFHRKCRS